MFDEKRELPVTELAEQEEVESSEQAAAQTDGSVESQIVIMGEGFKPAYQYENAYQQEPRSLGRLDEAARHEEFSLFIIGAAGGTYAYDRSDERRRDREKQQDRFISKHFALSFVENRKVQENREL